MKLEDIVTANMVHHPQNNLVRTPREMTAKIIANDVGIRIYEGTSREILKSLNIYF